ncbi:MAG TPA: hypothetical protein VI612_03470 [Candidatus Nanoarchaeia archaeon]|nr:hypothetical protein [Candidatus Nanoarchaeia archaeon]
MAQADFLGNDSSRRILTAESAHTDKLREKITLFLSNAELVVVPSLEAVVKSSWIPDFYLCAVSREQLSEATQELKVTPVVLIGSDSEVGAVLEKSPDETLEAAVERACKKHNLVGVANLNDLKSGFDAISSAVQKKEELFKCLEDLPEQRQRELLERDYETPRFLNLLRSVKVAHNEHKQDTFDALLIKSVLEWDQCHPSSPFKKTLEGEAAQAVVEYIKQRENGIRRSPLLGDSQHGEGGADRFEKVLHTVLTTPFSPLRWRICRLLSDDANGHPHAYIAYQRYQDSQQLQAVSDFKTPMMCQPLSLSDLGRNASFILMQEVPGPSLDKVLRKIDEEIPRAADNSRRDLLLKLRKELVKNYVERIAEWQNLDLKTFVKKPSGNDLIEEYKSRIDDFPGMFSVLAPNLFSDAEDLAFLTGLDCFGRVDASPENVVRIMDASLTNLRLRLDKVRYDRETQEAVFTIDDILRNTTNGTSIDRNKITENLYNVDLHYRYGHLLEDLSHIITAHETAFLIKDKNRRAADERSVLELTRGFLESVKRADLMDDRVSLYLMFFYRSARKLKLFAKRYICNAFNEYNSGLASKSAFDRKKRMFQEAIAHHARSCSVILGQLRRHLRKRKIDQGERKQVDSWYKKAHENYDAETARPFVEDTERLTDANARLYAQVSALSLTYQKLRNYLEKKNLAFEEGCKNAN